MESTLALGLGQPNSRLGDVAFNVTEHAQVVRDLESHVVVFPELSLTGYGMCQAVIDPDDPVLEPLINACAASSAVALAGAPTAHPNGKAARISMLRVDGTGAEVVYSKMNLGGDEPDHYSPGHSPSVVEVNGWRLGLAICKDNGQQSHARITADLGIDAYVAGVCETDDDRDVQRKRAHRVIDDHRVWVAYASFAGSTGGGFVNTPGRSAILDPQGTVRLQLGRSPGQSGFTTLTK